jgi:diguanylate cyclase (GGDEF)-like protein
VVSVYYAYVLCGFTSVLGAGLTFLLSHPQMDFRMEKVLRLYRLGFAFLIPLLSLAVIPIEKRALIMPFLLGSVATGAACLGWALRELIAEPLANKPMLVATFTLGLAVVGAKWALSPRAYRLALIGVYAVIGLLLLMDHAWTVRNRRDRPATASRSEQVLIITLTAYTGIFVTGWLHGLTHESAVYAEHGLYLPDWLLPVAATVIAIFPLLVAVTAFAVINERLVKRLENMMLTDALTGVYSRRGLNELGPLLVSEHHRQGHAVAVLMVDIDHFKRINDTHGHAVGDLALKHVGAVLRKHLRADALVARYGGEEFTALLPVQQTSEAVQAAERLRVAISETPLAEQTAQIQLTASIGIAIALPRTGLDDALVEADACLYQAKHMGRNRVVATRKAVDPEPVSI